MDDKTFEKILKAHKSNHTMTIYHLYRLTDHEPPVTIKKYLRKPDESELAARIGVSSVGKGDELRQLLNGEEFCKQNKEGTPVFYELVAEEYIMIEKKSPRRWDRLARELVKEAFNQL